MALGQNLYVKLDENQQVIELIYNYSLLGLYKSIRYK